mgnify:CR=1 FL=1
MSRTESAIGAGGLLDILYSTCPPTGDEPLLDALGDENVSHERSSSDEQAVQHRDASEAPAAKAQRVASMEVGRGSVDMVLPPAGTSFGSASAEAQARVPTALPVSLHSPHRSRLSTCPSGELPWCEEPAPHCLWSPRCHCLSPPRPRPLSGRPAPTGAHTARPNHRPTTWAGKGVVVGWWGQATTGAPRRASEGWTAGRLDGWTAGRLDGWTAGRPSLRPCAHWAFAARAVYPTCTHAPL